MPKTQITLEVDLEADEVTAVKQLLKDAVGEFVTNRSGAYVEKRYPHLSGELYTRKVAEVEFRKDLAKKLIRAADDVQIEYGMLQSARGLLMQISSARLAFALDPDGPANPTEGMQIIEEWISNFFARERARQRNTP